MSDVPRDGRKELAAYPRFIAGDSSQPFLLINESLHQSVASMCRGTGPLGDIAVYASPSGRLKMRSQYFGRTNESTTDKWRDVERSDFFTPETLVDAASGGLTGSVRIAEAIHQFRGYLSVLASA